MSKTPAVLVCDAETGNLEIAGLTVLDRLVVTAHRAGCAPITIIAETPARLVRAEALGVAVSFARAAPAGVNDPGYNMPPAEAGVVAGDAVPGCPTLAITAALLVDPRDLERVIKARGQLISPDGSPLPVKMTTLAPPPVVAEGVTHVVVDAASAADGERKLWDSLGSSADGAVDRYLNRPLGRLLSKILVQTSISPNAVSVASILIGLAAAPFFAAGKFVTGALILQLCAIIDCVDGDLARALFKESQLGKWLDLAGDQVVHVSIFVAIGVGVALTNRSGHALALGVSAAIGVLLCFPVIIRALRLPVDQRGALLSKLLDSTANRDFSVLLLVLALAGRMELFLWMAGLGIHVFWIALLLLQRGRTSSGWSREPA